MQVSTRSADWLVDALALRAHIGAALADVFADPGVVKVLHGADHDVLWLQVSLGACGCVWTELQSVSHAAVSKKQLA